MASTETRPSFRLPWSTSSAESDEGSKRESESPEDPTEASMESSGMHNSEEIETPDMIETSAPAAAAATLEPPAAAPRRATKFMAELSHAMHAAAEHARNETMERFQAEAKAVVEEIRASATSEVADLRRQADDDVAAIRDWSKAEIARIREETDARVAARKTGLDSEMGAHTAAVEARAERVTAVVAAFETQMSAFFERLNAEEDPTHIATMAEAMPDPPSLEGVAASIVPEAAMPSAPPVAWPEAGPEPDVEAEPEAEATSREPADAVLESEPEPTAEIDFAAAEAEALSFDGDLSALDDDAENESPTESSEPPDSTPAEALPAFEPTPGAQATTKVVVAGLASVASIANFKRSLARIGGVWSIAVSSGPNGEFVFTVNHDGGLGLPREIEAIAGFESRVTGESDGEILVSARDRDTVD